MYRLIESIRLENGTFSRLDLHRQRMEKSTMTLFGQTLKRDLETELAKTQFPAVGLFKARIVYTSTEFEVQFTPYTIKPVFSLKLTNGDGIEYSHKFEDRRGLNELFARKENADDILIVKGGQVTDTSYANIAFWDGQKWVTPSACLLPGTMRQFLLNSGTISRQEIVPSDLPKFKMFKLINSMLAWESPEVNISNIH
jgi:4-amino-4-deoxychorismate lyase